MTAPLLIAFGGLPATGKSTIAREVCRRIGAVYLRIDSIEAPIIARWSNEDIEDAGYRVACRAAADNLRLGHVVVADSVNSVDVTRQAYRAVAAEAEAPIFEIEIVCSDETQHERRVSTRMVDVEGLTPPTWEQIQSRPWQPWEAHLSIDTARTSSEQAVEAVVHELARLGHAPTYGRAHLILYVADQSESTQFWRTTLACGPSLDVPGMTEFDLNDGTVLGLMPAAGIKRLLPTMPDPATADGIPRAELYLLCDEPAVAHQRALEAGATELSALQPRDWGHEAAYSLDPDGHVVVFARPTP